MNTLKSLLKGLSEMDEILKSDKLSDEEKYEALKDLCDPIRLKDCIRAKKCLKDC